MTFRNPTDADVDRMVEIGIRSYPVPQRAPDDVRRWVAENPRASLGDMWIDDSQPHVAQAIVYPFEMVAWGRTWKVGGLGGVAVAADARRAGWGRRLVAHTESVLRERGCAWQILYPFRADFYRRLGYGTVDVRDVHRFPTTSIPDDEGADRVRTGTLADLETLMPVYERFINRRDGFLRRRVESHAARLAEEPPFVAVSEGPGGHVDGYLLYRIEGASDHFLHQRLVVRELVWTSDGAWRALWGFVSRLRDQVVEVVHVAHEDDALLHHLSHPSVAGGPMLPGGIHKVGDRMLGAMAKILDVEEVAAARPYGPGRARFSVTVTDPVAEPVTVTLDVRDGRAAVEPGDHAEESLETDIATWTQLECGVIGVRAARRLGVLTTTADVSVLESIFNRRSWGIFDGF